jgi:hypothetical protein
MAGAECERLLPPEVAVVSEAVSNNGEGQPTGLCQIGHPLMENHPRLAVDGA